MPEQSELFDLSRKHLVGRLVTSTVASGRIEDISMPGENKFRHMLVLSAADFPNCTGIHIMNDELPFFARDEVMYRGQPVLAVFGYDAEDVELFCKQVKVSYQIKQDSEDSEAQPFEAPFIWSYGNTDEFFTPESRTFKSDFEVSPFSNSMLGDQKVFVIRKDGKLHVRVPSQWPIHVRKSIAATLGLPIDEIQVYPQPYYAPYDQLVVLPSVLACIAAQAAEQTGELVQLSASMVSWQPRMKIEHETAYLADGSLLADRASCTVDLGAFPFFTTEICHNILAGLVSVYPLKAADVSIQVCRSSTPPANFFGDLGFSMALAGTENHFSMLASSLGMQPGIWRLDRAKEAGPAGFAVCQAVKAGNDFAKLESSVSEILNDSWYSRKYASNSQGRMLRKLDPAINYARGIGIASGEGIMGFSQQFNASADYALSVTMNQDQTITVNAGVHADRSMIGIWKDAVRQFFDIPAEDIIFLDVNDPEILDLGPSTLSRKVGLVSTLLLKACSELSRKVRFSRLPVSVTTEYEAELTDPFYFSSCMGSVAVDLHIDAVMLSPVIDNIWVNFHLGHVFDMDKLLNKARHTITTVMADICPRSSAKCNIDIKVKQDGSFASSSLTAGLRGLATAALVGAISQALGHPIRRIPVTSDDILAIASRNVHAGEKAFNPGGER